MAGGEAMVAFTRILHRATPDVLMNEVPSWRAAPLHDECDTWCEFPVADRANAVQQWIDAARQDPGLIKAWPLAIMWTLNRNTAPCHGRETWIHAAATNNTAHDTALKHGLWTGGSAAAFILCLLWPSGSP